MQSYLLKNEDLEVILLALQIFEKHGRKYPGIVRDEHFAIANRMTRELLIASAYTEKQKKEDNNGTTNADERADSR